MSETETGDALGASAGARMTAVAGGVRVRMYRQGLGDCFLLAFDKGEGIDNPFYVLIDCGVILGTRDPLTPIGAVVDDILASTGPRLDVLIVTHEHFDHVGAFQQVREKWQARPGWVGAVWMAWTEDPADVLAVQLKNQFKNDVDTLCLAVLRQQADSGPAVGAEDSGLSGIVRMYGEPRSVLAHDVRGERRAGTDFQAVAAADAGFSENTHAGMRVAKSLVPEGSTCYWRPGDMIDVVSYRTETEAEAGVRAYVLGPPRDIRLLRDINPSVRDPETYSGDAGGNFGGMAAGGPSEKAAFQLALRSMVGGPIAAGTTPPLSKEEMVVRLRCQPFEEGLGLSLGDVESALDPIPSDANEEQKPAFEAARATAAFLRRYYGLGDDKGAAESWRRIDFDWLGAADDLALQMDNYTNNTSLALAFELTSGSVLLFPGDAQVGNWISWDHISPPFQIDGKPISVGDLLSRTKLYKVGHHGSHNGTMGKAGLERMTAPDLVALLPVDESVAHVVKHWTEIPFDPLMKRLYERTQGRVVRVDLGVVTDAKPSFLPQVDWECIQITAKAFAASRVAEGPASDIEAGTGRPTPLYYEVEMV